ncbi:MAG: hypothetical protein ACREJO_05320 [Phycisphaerales bacterium]
MKVAVALLALSAAVGVSSVALADIPAYTLVGQYALPQGAAAWDLGPDGRVWGIVGNSIVHQESLNGSTYTPLGSVPAGTVASFGASFMRVSPTGQTIAIGDNNFGSGARVHFVPIAGLSTGGPTATLSTLSGNFDGAWDGNQFYISGAGSDFVPYLQRISFTDATGQPVATQIITGIGGASGGVAIRGGRVWTGVGFTNGSLATGDIRSFDLLVVNSAPSAVSYLTGAAIVGGPVLSASPLAFDAAGNLLVGGGDSFGGTSETGYAAVVDLATGQRLQLSPAGTQQVIYSVAFNNVTNELLVTANGIAYRYAVPTPGACAVVAFGGLLASRRKR